MKLHGTLIKFLPLIFKVYDIEVHERIKMPLTVCKYEKCVKCANEIVNLFERTDEELELNLFNQNNSQAAHEKQKVTAHL